MSETIAAQAAEENNADNIKEPRLGWMIGFLFLVSFIGLFALVPQRKGDYESILLTACRNKYFLITIFASGDDR